MLVGKSSDGGTCIPKGRALPISPMLWQSLYKVIAISLVGRPSQSTEEKYGVWVGVSSSLGQEPRNVASQ